MQDDAIRTARIHSAVHPGTRDEVFIWQNFQPAYRDLGNRASLPSHMNTSVENFTKELEVRRDLGNQASPVNRAYMRGPKVVDLKDGWERVIVFEKLETWNEADI